MEKVNALLKNKVFLIVQGADILQQIGIWTRNMALLFYIMEMTNNNPTAVTLLTTLEYLPIFIFSLIGGTYADRWNPKKTVIYGDLLSAVSMLLIMFLISNGIWQSVFAATVISAIVSQFSQPSSAVIFKNHIPENLVASAIGISQSLMSLFTILGPIIGTFIYTQLGLETSIWVLFFIFITASFLQMFLPKMEKRNSEKETKSALTDIKEGLIYVFKHKNLKYIASLFFVVGVGFGITQPLDVFVIMERLGLPKESVQWFSSAEGIGMLLGGVLAVTLLSFVEKHSRTVFKLTLIAQALFIIVEIVSQWPLLTFIARILSGVSLAFFQVIFSTMMIKEVAKEYVGRTNGIIMPLMVGGLILGSASSGFIVLQVGLFGAYLFTAGLISCCIFLTNRLQLVTSKNELV